MSPMTLDGASLEVGMRVRWWLCRNGCGIVEWHEADGQLCACPVCGAGPDDGKRHGIYTVTSVGNANEPWEVRR